jgi:hypothetical protein
MAAICGLTTQCPGAVKMLEATAALARTDESVKKYGSCNCRASANIVARRRANASACNAEEAGGDKAEI